MHQTYLSQAVTLSVPLWSAHANSSDVELDVPEVAYLSQGVLEQLRSLGLCEIRGGVEHRDESWLRDGFEDSLVVALSASQCMREDHMNRT
jgi:hypothetical protein